MAKRLRLLHARADRAGLRADADEVRGLRDDFENPSMPRSRWLAIRGGFLLQYMGYLPGFLGVNAILRGSVARSCCTRVAPPSGAWITRSCGASPASRLATISTGVSPSR
jgi:hypothetical protein